MRILSTLGLVFPVGCQAPPAAPAPTVVDLSPPPQPDLPAPAPSGSQTKPLVSAACGTDEFPIWACGRPTRPDGPSFDPVPIEECPKASTDIEPAWSLVSSEPPTMGIDGARTETFRRRGTDDAGKSAASVCCYGACFSIPVRAHADPVPKRATKSPFCIPAMTSSVPDPGRNDCAAAVKAPHSATYLAYSQTLTLQHGATQAKMAGFSDTKMCCYEDWRVMRIMRGRPLRIEGVPRMSDPVGRIDWRDATHVGLAPVPSASERATLATLFAEDAALEHASVAAFAKTSLALIAHGAPPSLIEGCHRAAEDEVRHATLCYELASRYAGRSLGPGPLPAGPWRMPTTETLLLETVIDGCVGETVASAAMQQASTQCADARLRQALQQVSEEEMQHAELAFQIVKWLLLRDGALVSVVSEALATLASPGAGSSQALPTRRAAEGLARFGVLDADSEAALAADVVAHVVRPCLQELLLSASG